jgi:uncharacterized membrane protein (UPF0127 family)
MLIRSKAAALLLTFALAACTKAPAADAAATTSTQPPPANGPRIVYPNGNVVQLELAVDDETRAQGLMYRDSLRPGTGMLFVFQQDGEYPFWMKNTIIPLDMVWIDQRRTIAHVKSDVPPCKADPCPSYPPNASARYVLELPAGEANKQGLKAGDALRFEGLENVAPR